jgi:5-methylcytosine-specific restriction endonuclease McrA
MENVSMHSEIEALDVTLRALSRQRAQSAHALCHRLLKFDALNGPGSLGFASIREYGEHALGLTAREIRECLRVGRRLTVLARVDAALEAGTLSWSAARALTRVAVPETEAEWLRQAQSGPMRDLEAAVSVSSAGDLPPDADTRPVAPARTRFVFEVDSVDAQVVADVLALWRAELGGDLDLADVFVELCRSALASAAGSATGATATAAVPDTVPATDGPGRACATGIPPERFQIVLQKCPTCADVVHVGHGSAAHVVAPSVVAQAECDAVVVDLARGGQLTRAIPPKVRRRVAHRDGYRCAVPGCGARLWLDVHHLVPRCRGGTHDEMNLALLCSGHHKRVHEGTLHLRRGDDGQLIVRRGVGAACDFHEPVARRASGVRSFPSGRRRGHGEICPEVSAQVSAPLAAAIEGCAAEFGWVVPEFVASRLAAPCPPDDLGRAIAAVAAARGWPRDDDGWYRAAP